MDTDQLIPHPNRPPIQEFDVLGIAPTRWPSTADPAVRHHPRRTKPATWDPTSAVEDLVRAVGDGDERAWAEMIRRYERLVFHVARRHGLANAECADVCQATWIRLFRNADSLSQPSRITSWLVTTARRESLRLIAGAARRRESADELTPETAHRAASNPPTDLDAPMLQKERDLVVRAALDGLSGRAGAVLRLLMDEEGLSYAEVAARLGIAPGSVGSLRNRAIRRLREDQRLRSVLLTVS
jgi:RNA polymerase sigma factor (sigma-70 family)